MHIALTSLNLADAERLLIELALEQFGSPSEAAPALGLTSHAVKRRIVKYRIEWPRTSAPRARGAAQPISATLDSLNLATAERLLLEQALKVTGEMAGAGVLLGITRHAVKRRIVKHGIKFRSVHPAHAGRP